MKNSLTKTFIKKIRGYERDEIIVLATHSQEIWESLKDSRFFTPRVLKLVGDNIHYEYMNIPDRLDHLWIRQNDFDDTIFIKLGEMLSTIHNSHQSNLLHGDYVLHNIFLNTLNDICLIDCHPPEVVGYDRAYLYGDAHLEMYLFLLNLPSSFGIRASLHQPTIIKSAMCKFRCGYGLVRGSRSLFNAVIRFYSIRRASGFSSLNTSIHVLVGLFFIRVSKNG